MTYILLSLMAAGCIWVAFQLWKESKIHSAASRASAEDLEQIALELAQVGNAKPRSFFILSNETPKTLHFSLKLPDQMDVTWAGGKTITLTVDDNPKAEDDCGSVSEEINSLADLPRLAPIPRIKMKNGKEANRYQPDYWFKKSSELKKIATHLSPNAPEQVLNAVVNRIGRVNAPFQWVQEPPKTKCQKCNKRLTPIFEYWGGEVGLSQDATYYVAGCNCLTGKYYVFVQNS